MPTGFFQSIIRSTVAPVRSANSGSGIGESLSILGRTVGQIADLNSEVEQKVAAVDHEISMRERERDDDALALSVAVEQTKATQRLRIFDEENRTNADYEKLYAAQVDKEVGQLRGMIGVNDRVAKRYEVPLTQMAQSEKADAVVYATKLRVQATSAGYAEMAETLTNVAMSDPKKALPGIAMLRETIRTSTVIDDALKPMVEREMIAPIIVAGMNAAIDRGEYADVEAAMNAGTFDAEIGKKAKEEVLRNIEREKVAQQRDAAQAAVDAKQAAQEALDFMRVSIDGGENWSASKVQTTLKAAADVGIDASVIKKISLDIDDAKILRSYNGANDPTGEKSAAAVAAMDARFAAGKATDADVRMRDKLAGYADSRVDKVGADLSKIAAQGIDGKKQVLAQIARMPERQRHAIAERATRGLGQVSMLAASVQELALRGMEDLAAKKDLIDVGKSDAAFRAATRTAMKGMSEQGVQDMMMATNAIYVGMYGGAVSGQEFSPANYQKALHLASGGSYRRAVGGQSVPQGGIGLFRGKSVAFPDNYTAPEFDKVISRMMFAEAVYSNGMAVNKADILKNYTPVFFGNSENGQPIYHFVNSANEKLKMKNGAYFPVRIP